MTNVIGGACAKCGAPYYLPDTWMGVVPPTPQPTCACWNMPSTVTVTSSGQITIAPEGPPIDVPSIMRAAEFEEGFAAGRRAALEEAAKCSVCDGKGYTGWTANMSGSAIPCPRGCKP